jgi:hypothetical protein
MHLNFRYSPRALSVFLVERANRFASKSNPKRQAEILASVSSVQHGLIVRRVAITRSRATRPEETPVFGSAHPQVGPPPISVEDF